MKLKRSRSLVAVIVIAMMLMPALSGLASAQNNGDRPTLKFALDAADLASLDPHQATGTQDRTVVDMVFNGLIRYKPGDSTAPMEPDLATAVPEPQVENGKQTWTFALRKGVMCQAGPKTEAYELTSADVVYSFKKAADPKRSAFSGDYAGFTAEAVDDYTVKVTQDPPLSANLFLPKVANYAGGFIVCSKAVDAMGDDAFKTNPVGTGPFAFKSYTPQTSIELAANDDYFRGKPKLAGVDLRFMPDATSRELALQSGDVDAIDGLSQTQWVQKIEQNTDLKADVFGVGEVAFFNFDVTAKPLDNIKVRQAIAYAINRDDHLALYGGPPVAEDVYSVVPSQFMPGGLTKDEAQSDGVLYEQNLDKAKELMKEAGYADGFEMKLITSEMDAYRANYEVLQAELGKIGIKIDLQVVDHPTMHAEIRKGVNPITLYVAYRPNADAYLTQFFQASSIVVTGADPITNFAHYSAIDDLIAKARAETDPEAQAKLWQDANVQILKDVAAYPLHFQNQVYARQKYVDYGHELVASLALYPQIDETTTMTK
jgi:peptide/nickel transport system substrate-binding protein